MSAIGSVAKVAVYAGAAIAAVSVASLLFPSLAVLVPSGVLSSVVLPVANALGVSEGLALGGLVAAAGVTVDTLDRSVSSTIEHQRRLEEEEARKKASSAAR